MNEGLKPHFNRYKQGWFLPRKPISFLWAAILCIQCVFAYSVHGEMSSTKVGILYSKKSEDYFGYPFEFRQLYTAVQSQALQAGVPFDLLVESDLADMEKLRSYRAIIIPALQVVDPDKVSLYRNNIKSLLQDDGVSLIAADAFFSYNPSGEYQENDTQLAMDEIFGLRFRSFGDIEDVTLSASGSSHPALALVESPDTLAEYNSTFFQEFLPVNDYQTDFIAGFNIQNEEKIVIQSGARGNGKYVHFSDTIKMVDSKILWAAIKWAISETGTAQENIHLSMTRENGLFIPRNDMDLSRFLTAVTTVEVPLLSYLNQWKESYNFKGSFYINIGNNQQLGEFTDWDLSGPLYNDYISIGNEIGTHSYTHPRDTKLLSISELEFEFSQSQIEISNELGNTVRGTGIPGEDENLYVYDNIKSYFDYISGHTLYSESEHIQSLGIGFLTPEEETVYFSLNMTPDFVLGDILQLDLDQFSQTWINEFDQQSLNMRQPVLHWLWHDYGLINPNNSPNYGPKPFEDIVAYAAGAGFEFITLEDYTDRFKAFKSSNVSVDYVGSDQMEIEVQGNDLGGLTIELPVGKNITSAGGHYAYNSNQLFLPSDGGLFSLTTNQSPENVSRIISLDSGFELISITGDGTILDFTINGQGRVSMEFNSNVNGLFEVLSAGETVYTASGATTYFQDIGSYTVQVRLTDDLKPFAKDADAETLQGQSVTIQLDAGDYDGSLTEVSISTSPQNGIATLDNLTLSYTPYLGYVGDDQLIYKVTDDKGAIAEGTVSISIEGTNIVDGDPEYNLLVRPPSIDGDPSEWEGLEAIGQDPVDFSNENDLLDYTSLTLAHNDSKFFIFYTSNNEAPLNWAHNTFIDSDGLSQTGFILGSLGADLLVQGELVYRYTGNGLDWVWEQISNIIIAQNGPNVELCLDRSLFQGVTSIKLALLADNSAYPDGSGLDIFPDDMFSSRTGFFKYNFFTEATNSVPIAQSASYSMNIGESVNVALEAFDADEDDLTFQVISQPDNGLLSGDLPNLTYTPDNAFAGLDTFSFIVSDGMDTSQPAEIEITVIDPNAGNNQKMSNIPQQDLFIDGNLDDWLGLSPYPADPVDQIGSQHKADLVRLRLAHSQSNLFVAIENASDIEFNWAYSIYVDTDLDANSGFKNATLFSGIGADYLIQSNYIFQYTGTGEDWSWSFIGSAEAVVDGPIAEMSLPLSFLGSPGEINFVVIGDNLAYEGGITRDLYPDDSVSNGTYLNYFVGNSSSSLSTQTGVKLAGPIPPLVPHTLRVRFIEPTAINPNGSKIMEGVKNYWDIRMNARPNSTWNLLHSDKLDQWSTIRSWKITGTWSEFSFPIQENDKDGGHEFFDALESSGPQLDKNDF